MGTMADCVGRAYTCEFLAALECDSSGRARVGHNRRCTAYVLRAVHGPRIFDDLRVLDFSAIIADSYCTRMLADLGADVLKVGPPGGELMHHIGPMRGEFSTVSSALNSGKRSLKLDLKQAGAADLCKRLVAQCDVVVENFSPGVMQRLGLDYASLRPHNDKRVMCSISGYGQDGPAAGLPAFAPIAQALSGTNGSTK